jgi:hypothetical protein
VLGRIEELQVERDTGIDQATWNLRQAFLELVQRQAEQHLTNQWVPRQSNN